MRRPPIPEPPHRGGCHCGAVRYSYHAAPLAAVACHCRDCQKLSGATNLLTVYADRASFRHERGEVARYRKRGDSGGEADYVRCARCGTRLWHEPLAAQQYVMIAAGTLDDPAWVVPAAHIWVSRAAPSARIPEDVATWNQGPIDRAELVAAFTAAYGSAGPPALAAEGMRAKGSGDFDFFIGRWRVKHRRLKERLAGCKEWDEFGGSSVAQKVLGGLGNMDDNLLDLPDGAYRAVTLRAFNRETGLWSIWWLDGRHPGALDTPMVGRFENGVGTFFADDVFEGRPIRVRFLWTRPGYDTARWEQAFSTDGGVSWETNWVMEFTRDVEG